MDCNLQPWTEINSFLPSIPSLSGCYITTTKMKLEHSLSIHNPTILLITGSDGPCFWAQHSKGWNRSLGEFPIILGCRVKPYPPTTTTITKKKKKERNELWNAPKSKLFEYQRDTMSGIFHTWPHMMSHTQNTDVIKIYYIITSRQWV